MMMAQAPKAGELDSSHCENRAFLSQEKQEEKQEASGVTLHFRLAWD
jgi:hypothetical protein